MFLKHLKKEFHQYKSTCTIHGIPHIFNSPKTLVKLIWTFIFLSCFFLSLILIASSITNYLSYKTASQLSVRINNEIDFPAITICNMKYYDTTNEKFPVELSDQLRNFLQSYTSQFVRNPFIFDSSMSSVYNSGINYIKSLQFKSNLTNEQRKSLNTDISDMLMGCQFNSRTCSGKHFIEKWNSIHGRCFQFNSGKNEFGEKIAVKKMKNGGSEYGLRLELFLGDHNNSLQKSSGIR